MVLVLAGAGAGAWEVRQHGRTDAAVPQRSGTHALLDEGWDNTISPSLAKPVGGEGAANLARSPWASAALRDKAVAFESDAQERLQRAEENGASVAELLDIADPHDGGRYRNDEGGPGAAATLPGEDKRDAAAFRRWEAFDIDRTPENDLLSRLQREPKAVVRQATAGLDNYPRPPRQESARREMAQALPNCSATRSERRGRSLRQIMVGEAPRRVENVVGLLGGLGAWPAVWELGHAPGLRGLLDFPETRQPAAEHALTLAQLAPLRESFGDRAGAEALLRRGLAARPTDPVLLLTLGRLLEHQLRWMKRSSITGPPAPLILPWVCGWPRPWVGQGTGANKKNSFRT